MNRTNNKLQELEEFFKFINERDKELWNKFLKQGYEINS